MIKVDVSLMVQGGARLALQAGASGCKRVHTGAINCKRVQGGASGCMGVQGGARGCEGVQWGKTNNSQALYEVPQTLFAVRTCLHLLVNTLKIPPLFACFDDIPKRRGWLKCVIPWQ